MSTPDRCPACQSQLEPQAAVCARCGRILADAAIATIPLASAPAQLPAAVPLIAGQALAHGRYTVQRALSRGGMGALYLATDHEAFGRTVVIKALLDYADPTQPHEQQVARARFEREARTLAALAYPTIPQIFSYFAQDGQTYIVMAYIEGRDMLQGLTRHDPETQRRVAGQAYALSEVVRWGVALCRTLEYLASRTPAVLHLDIKPANLILSAQSGDLFLVDFGAARGRLMAAAGGGAKTMAFGTPGYAAPEQYQGQSDLGSDVYALAATLYHLATDDDPSAHPFQFPRLGYLGYLGPILRAALESKPAERPNATALREQLEALLQPEGRRILYAPDQQAMQNEQELARWCEEHWADAATWLAHGLPDQIQFSWVKLALAAELRRCIQQNPDDPNAALDATLALLDKDGFGAAAPAITADKASIETELFDVAPNQLIARGALTLRNQSRRYARVRVAMPVWMSTPTSQIALVPGQSAILTLEADLNKMPVVPRKPALRAQANGGAELVVPIQGRIPSRQQSADPKTVLILLLLMFVVFCVLPTLVSMIQSFIYAGSR